MSLAAVDRGVLDALRRAQELLLHARRTQEEAEALLRRADLLLEAQANNVQELFTGDIS